MSKFNSVPIEVDTKIINSEEVKINEFDALHQKWFWDGIYAESLIFVSNEINHLNDDDLKLMLIQSRFVNKETQITIDHSDSGFTFLNFNFETDE
jgi:hypothetical protein